MGRQVRCLAPSIRKKSLSTDFVTRRLAGPVPHDASYYAKCMLGGAIACGFTHAGITPLDVAKCNIQASSPFACNTRFRD